MIAGRLFHALAICTLASCAYTARAQDRQALVIGVSDYPKYDSADRLKYANTDALKFATLLESEPAGRFRVARFVNQAATREALWNAVDKLRRQPRPPDTLFIFFSGHAEVDPETGQLFLMPHDGDRQHLDGSAVPAADFFEKLRLVGAEHLVIFIDACRSGAVLAGKGGGVTASESLSNVFKQLNEKSDGTVIEYASSSPKQSSWEDDERQQGIFTYFLIKGLEGAADGVGPYGPPDGRITSAELATYLQKQVPDRARLLGMPIQTPLVSPNGYGSLVLALTGAEVAKDTTPRGWTIGPAQAQRLQSDPELKLMVRVAALQAKLEPFDAVHKFALQESLDAARVRKISSIKSPVSVGSLIGPVISADGNLLVACAESSVLVFDLSTGAELKSLPLFVHGPTSGSLRLDSCDISISQDDNFAVVRAEYISGTARLTLFSLGNSPVPPVVAGSYDFGSFAAEGLLLAKGTALTLLSGDGWSAVTSFATKDPVKGIVTDADSHMIGVVGEHDTTVYNFNPGSRQFSPIRTVRSSDSCISTIDDFVCEHDGQWEAANGSDGSQIDRCTGGCRLYASAARSYKGARWSTMFQDLSLPEILHFKDATSQSTRSRFIQIPESPLTARLLVDRRVVVVSRTGAVYRFTAMGWADCCTVMKSSEILRAGAGSDAITAVLIAHASVGTLAMYRSQQPVAQIPLSDYQWVRKIILQNGNRTVALVGDGKLRLLQFSAAGFATKPAIHDLDCGLPIAFQPMGAKIACVGSSGNIQVRDLRTHSIERELTDEPRPQTLAMASDTVFAVGTSSSGTRTLVSMWRLADGTLISQQLCGLDIPGRRPLGFLREAAQFIQMDTPSRLLARNSLTCDAGPPVAVGQGAIDIESSATAGVAILLAVERNAFFSLEGSSPYVTQIYRVDTSIDELSISPDGTDVVQTDGRILRVPLSPANLLSVAKRAITREFTSSECQDFFPGRECPKLLSPVLSH